MWSVFANSYVDFIPLDLKGDLECNSFRVFNYNSLKFPVCLRCFSRFDNIVHNILLECLRLWAGIQGNALNWFASFISGRTSSVELGNSSSVMKCGVPQGSILGPVLFKSYMLLLADICQKQIVYYHLFDDATQLWIVWL